VSRLSAVAREALPADQRRFHDAVRAIRRRPVSGPFIVTMNGSPDLAARIAHLGHYFHSRGQADESILPLRVRAFIALVGARALDAPYEWAAWVNWALEARVPQDTVDVIREGRTPVSLTDEEALLARLCTELVSGSHRLSDATYSAALERYGRQGIVELVVTLGYFAMIAMPLNAFEMEMSAEQKAGRKPFAPLEIKGSPYSDEGAGFFNPPPPAARAAVTRLPLRASHEDVAPEHQHFLDRIVRTRGWIAPLFQVLLHTPDVAERIAHLGAFLLYDGSLSAETRLLVGLIAAQELDCDYVRSACSGMARCAGLEDVFGTAIANGGSPAGTADHRLLLSFCHALLRGNHHVSEAVYRDCVARLGMAATVQVSVLLGYCVMAALVANAFGITSGADQDRPLL